MKNRLRLGLLDTEKQVDFEQKNTRLTEQHR
jgi:hypothetical protein